MPSLESKMIAACSGATVIRMRQLLRSGADKIKSLKRKIRELEREKGAA